MGVDSVTRKDKELVDMQIKMKNMMDKNENNLSPEGQEITDILKSEIHILTKEVAELKEDIGKKETVMKKHTQDLMEKSKDVLSKEAEIEDLIQAKEQMDIKIKNLAFSCKANEDIIDKLKSETDTFKKQEAELSKSIEEQKENFEALKGKFEMEKEENRSLKADLSQKEVMITEKENINKDKIREIQKLESELKQKEQDNERFMKEKEDLMTKIEAGDGANMAIQQLTSENSILQDRLLENAESFKEKEAKLSSEMEQMRSDIISLKQESQEMKENNEKNKEIFVEKDSIIQKLEKTINELNQRQKELGNEMEDMISKHKIALSEAKEKSSELTNELQVKEQAYEKMKKSLDKTEQDLLTREDNVEELSIKVKSLEKEK